MAQQRKLPITSAQLLSFGLAFVFAYAGISSLLHPLEWAGYLPGFLMHVAPQLVLIRLLALYELVLSLWLLTSKYRQYAALLSAATLGGIVLLNLGQLIVTFRDVGLCLMALALFLE